MAMATLDDDDDSDRDLSLPDRFDDDWVERVYLPKLHAAVCRTLGARDMTVFDWMLRKWAASFPKRYEGEKNVDAY